jgi:hypothetical protein
MGFSPDPGIEVDNDLDVRTSFDVHILLAGNRERITRNGSEGLPAGFESYSESAVCSRLYTRNPLTVPIVDIDGGLVGEIWTGILLGLNRTQGAQEYQPIDTLRCVGAEQRVVVAAQEKEGDTKPPPKP